MRIIASSPHGWPRPALHPGCTRDAPTRSDGGYGPAFEAEPDKEDEDGEENLGEEGAQGNAEASAMAPALGVVVARPRVPRDGRITVFSK